MSAGPSEPRAPRVTAQVLSAAHSCVRRLWLRHHAAHAAAPVTEHGHVLRERGDENERRVAARFEGLVGPIWRREGSFEDAAAESLRWLRETRRPLWQPVLLTPDGRRSAQPDFLHWDGDDLVVLEVRLALRPAQRRDFALQLAHLRHVIAAAAGVEPARFEVSGGDGSVTPAVPLEAEAYEEIVRGAVQALASPDEPDLLRSHSACRRCMFYDHCWDRAEHERRIEILPEVHPDEAAAWHERGVRTIEDLAAFDTGRLPRGPRRLAAQRAVRVASAWRDDRAEWLQAPALPRPPIVWFDVEGDARGEEAETPIYLWGLAAENGTDEPAAESFLAGSGAAGDARAWEAFLARARALLDRQPGQRWVHWDASEPLWVRRYAERLGDPGGTAPRLLAACFDLKRELDRCVRLPLRSYSIKHVAPWMGFAWRNPEAGSEWSLARFDRARRTADPAERERALAEVREYNEDDLRAMRAVWAWLGANAPAGAPKGPPRRRPHP